LGALGEYNIQISDNQQSGGFEEGPSKGPAGGR
jgi:hypothetical protein